MKFAIFALCAAILAGCSIDAEYEVTGSAKSVSVTYYNAEGSICQQSDVSVPFRESMSAKAGDYLSISAQNNGETGTVNVAVKRNGDVFKSGSSSGAYCIAQAGGEL